MNLSSPNTQIDFKGILRRTLLMPLLLFAAALGALLWNISCLIDVQRASQHAVKMLLQISHFQVRMVDMETGLRGFQLTGEASFLGPYNEAIALIPDDAHDLAELVRGNEGQLARFKEVEATRASWQAWGARILKNERVKGSVSLDETVEGKRLMDKLRGLLAAMTADESDRLHMTAEDTSRMQGFSGVFLLGLFTVVGGVVAWWVSRQIRLMDQAYQNVIRETRERKEWFRVTLASIGDAVMVTDRDGMVRFMNAEAERMTGWEWTEAEGKPLRSIFRIVSEETRLTVDDPVEKVFKEKRVVGLANHTLLLSKKGVEWPIEDSAAPVLDANQEIIGVALVFHDATELRKVQRVMKTYAEDLERKVLERTLELHRTVGELQAFSYSVSHDLRAPLRAMQGFASTLLEDYAGKLDETGRDYLRRIGRAAERLDRLVQDVLTYSRSGEGEGAIKTVDLDALVAEVIQQYPGIREHETTIRVASPLDDVLGHEAGLTQIVSNLLMNAIKFADPQRPLSIVIRTEVLPKNVRLWVEDNGIGIETAHLGRIFRMFEQVDPKIGGGTGIGLAIVQKSAEKMHATAGVESIVGKGSRFWIEFVKPTYVA